MKITERVKSCFQILFNVIILFNVFVNSFTIQDSGQTIATNNDVGIYETTNDNGTLDNMDTGRKTIKRKKHKTRGKK